MSHFSDKKEARAFFLPKRRAIDEDEVRQRSASLCNRISALDEFLRADTVLIYSPTKNEPDLTGIAHRAWKLGKRVAFPISITETCTLDFRLVGSMDELNLGAYGIYEPSNDAPRIMSSEHMLCIVPAMAVDKSGFRLGYGKGYYDRFLKNFSGRSVCALLDDFVCEEIPHDENDIPVNIIIFETGVVKAK